MAAKRIYAHICKGNIFLEAKHITKCFIKCFFFLSNVNIKMNAFRSSWLLNQTDLEQNYLFRLQGSSAQGYILREQHCYTRPVCNRNVFSPEPKMCANYQLILLGRSGFKLTRQVKYYCFQHYVPLSCLACPIQFIGQF